MSNVRSIINARHYAKHKGKINKYYRDKYRDDPEPAKAARRVYLASPRGVFTSKRRNAKVRGVEFWLTYEEWWEIWRPHWENRKKEGLMMCRLKEPGPYSTDNVYIGDMRSNREDHCRNQGIVRKRIRA